MNINDMSLIGDVPARLALMARDASTAVNEAYFVIKDALTAENRPAWVVETAEGDYPPIASGEYEFTEVYPLVLVGKSYGQGEDAEHELVVRTIIAQTISYLVRRPQLVFSNTRSLEAAALGPLAGVKWIRVSRERVGTITLGAEDEEFYGGIIKVTVTGGSAIREIIA